MSVLGSIGLAAAERLEKSVGPGVALRSYKAILGGGERNVMMRAALGAFRCALALRDELELAAVSAYWETLVDVDGRAAIAELTVPLLLKGRETEGAVLASAEAKRRPCGKSLYLKARALEAAGRPHEEAFAACAEQAEDVALRSAARSKQLEAMIARGASIEERLAVAAGIDLAAASAPQKLLAAEARLSATSRFARAAALSALEELSASDEPDIARRAICAAASHADAVGYDLSWVEADRVAAALASWPDDEQRAAATARLDARRRIAAEQNADAIIAEAADLEPGFRRHLEHARATIAGYGYDEPPPTTDHELALVTRCLSAITLLRASSWRDAELAVRELSQAAKKDATAVPRAAWIVIRLASDADASPKGLRLAALELLSLMLDVAPSGPSEGFLAYAAVAHRLRAAELREALLRCATRHAEPEAASFLAADLAQRARQAASNGDRSAALSLLREARAVGG